MSMPAEDRFEHKVGGRTVVHEIDGQHQGEEQRMEDLDPEFDVPVHDGCVRLAEALSSGPSGTPGIREALSEKAVDDSTEGWLAGVGELVAGPHHRLVESDQRREVDGCGCDDNIGV